MKLFTNSEDQLLSTKQIFSATTDSKRRKNGVVPSSCSRQTFTKIYVQSPFIAKAMKLSNFDPDHISPSQFTNLNQQHSQQSKVAGIIEQTNFRLQNQQKLSPYSRTVNQNVDLIRTTDCQLDLMDNEKLEELHRLSESALQKVKFEKYILARHNFLQRSAGQQIYKNMDLQSDRLKVSCQSFELETSRVINRVYRQNKLPTAFEDLVAERLEQNPL